MDKTIKIFIGGLPPTLTTRKMNEIFREFESDIQIDLNIDYNLKMNKGFAFILVKNQQVAEQIVSQQFLIRNRCI